VKARERRCFRWEAPFFVAWLGKSFSGSSVALDFLPVGIFYCRDSFFSACAVLERGQRSGATEKKRKKESFVWEEEKCLFAQETTQSNPTLFVIFLCVACFGNPFFRAVWFEMFLFLPCPLPTTD
jgi:hypothetical protein